MPDMTPGQQHQSTDGINNFQIHTQQVTKKKLSRHEKERHKMLANQ